MEKAAFQFKDLKKECLEDLSEETTIEDLIQGWEFCRKKKKLWIHKSKEKIGRVIDPFHVVCLIVEE